MNAKELIAKVCKTLVINQKQLVKMMGVDQAAITRWKTDCPEHRITQLQELISKGHAQTKSGHSESVHDTSSVDIPIISDPDNCSKVATIALPQFVLGGQWQDCYILRCNDDALAPDALRGDYVVIKPGKPNRKTPVLAKENGIYQMVKHEKSKELTIENIVGSIIMFLRSA